MNRKWLFGCLGVFAGLIAITATWKIVADNREAARDRAALTAELKLSRDEGLPTTWKEFAATIQAVSPSENAAPYYKRIGKEDLKSATCYKLQGDLILRESPEHIAAVLVALRKEKADLDLLDTAVELPWCWFNRDWSKGGGVLYPEAAKMKYAARLLALRASLAVAKRNPDLAIRDIRKVFRLGDHEGDEGTLLPSLVRLSIYATGIQQLATWSAVHRDEPKYLHAFSSALRIWPKLNLQNLHRDELCLMQDIVEMSITPKGRAELGLKEEDISPIEGMATFLLSRPKAKVKIAKAERELWESYGLPPLKRKKKMEQAKLDLFVALAAYPTASTYYSQMVQDDGKVDLSDLNFESRRLTYVALEHVLAMRTIPKSAQATGVLSPFDGKSATCTFDGRQFTIALSAPDKDTILRIPSDGELNIVRKTTP